MDMFLQKILQRLPVLGMTEFNRSYEKLEKDEVTCVSKKITDTSNKILRTIGENTIYAKAPQFFSGFSVVHGKTVQLWKRADPLIISSFDHKVLCQCNEKAPEYGLGHLFKKLPLNWLRQAKDVNAVTIHVDCDHLMQVRVQDAKSGKTALQ
jgi:glycerophosphoryl diester phosphodiesterase